MYRLSLQLKIEHAEEGDGYEQVKLVKETLLVGDENHREMPNALQTMIRRLFTRLKEVDTEKKKIQKPGLVLPTDQQTKAVNRVFRP